MWLPAAQPASRSSGTRQRPRSGRPRAASAVLRGPERAGTKAPFASLPVSAAGGRDAAGRAELPRSFLRIHRALLSTFSPQLYLLQMLRVCVSVAEKSSCHSREDRNVRRVRSLGLNMRASTFPPPTPVPSHLQKPGQGTPYL